MVLDPKFITLSTARRCIETIKNLGEVAQDFPIGLADPPMRPCVRFHAPRSRPANVFLQSVLKTWAAKRLKLISELQNLNHMVGQVPQLAIML